MNLPLYQIGYGNVGKFVSKKLLESGFAIHGVVVRNKESYSDKIQPLSIHFCTIDEVKERGPLIFLLCVKDDQIIEICKTLKRDFHPESFILHLSGSFDTRKILPFFSNAGFIYPLQTFSINTNLEFNKIPVFTGGQNTETISLAFRIGKYLSDNNHSLEEEKRHALHLCAVIVNNFGNRLFGIAQDIAKHENLDFQLLHPLVEETIRMIFHHNHSEVQTGPARRKDSSIISRQINYLKENGLFREVEIYKLFTQLIQDNENRQ